MRMNVREDAPSRRSDEDALTSSSLSYDATLAAIFAMVTIDPDMPMTRTGIADGMASLADPAVRSGEIIGGWPGCGWRARARGGGRGGCARLVRWYVGGPSSVHVGLHPLERRAILGSA